MPITLQQVVHTSRPPDRPLYSMPGYVIEADGTTHALFYAHYHGVVLALLYPEDLKAFRFPEDDRPSGYKWPEDGSDPGAPEDWEYGQLDRLVWPPTREDINVFHFQRFEILNHARYPVIRVCPSRLSGEPSMDLPRYYKVTDAQLEALRLVGQTLGYDRTTLVHTDEGDLSWPKFLAWAQTREVETSPVSREST